MLSEVALKKLLDGNERFINDEMLHPHQSMDRLREVREKQTPFAAILSCSDSRTSPTIIFDQGIGDLFVIRTAGNIADEVAIGSIELALENFGVPLVVVLGHQNCGAVRVAMNAPKPSDIFKAVVDPIKPAVEAASVLPGDPVENTAKINVQNMVEHIKKSSLILNDPDSRQRIIVAGAYYRFDSGQVELLDQL